MSTKDNFKATVAVDDAVPGSVHRTVFWVVWDAVKETVFRSMDWTVDNAGNWVVGRAVSRAVQQDPEHPALQVFLREAGRSDG